MRSGKVKDKEAGKARSKKSSVSAPLIGAEDSIPGTSASRPTLTGRLGILEEEFLRMRKAKTALWNAREELLESCNLFFDILHAIPNRINLIDESLRIVFTNRHFVEDASSIFQELHAISHTVHVGAENPCRACLIQDVFATGILKRAHVEQSNGETTEMLLLPLWNEIGRVRLVVEYVCETSHKAQIGPDGLDECESLECLVEHRTRQLVEINERLRQEIIFRREAESALKRRDAILEAVSFAAHKFFLASEWQSAIHEVLAHLGSVVGVDQIHVFHRCTVPESGASTMKTISSWSKGTVSGELGLTLDEFSRKGSDSTGGILELHGGMPVYGTLDDFPERIQKALVHMEISALAFIPIMVESNLWGFMAFFDFQMKRKWSGMEIEALRIAANILGGAIQRQRLEEVIRGSRARYRAIVDDQTEMICRYQDSGNITFVNDSYCRYFGMDRPELLGKSFFPLSDKRGRSMLKQIRNRICVENRMETFEHQLTVPGKGLCWHRWTIRGIFDEQGSLMELQAVGQDITEKKRIEGELQRVLSEQEKTIEKRTSELRSVYEGLIQSEKLATLGLLISGIAHEINNPNNFISFNMPILKDYIDRLVSIADAAAAVKSHDDFFGMSYREFRGDIYNLLENMRRGSTRITDTVARLRSFSMPTGWNEREAVELRSVVENSVALCRGNVRKNVRSLELEIPSVLPLVYGNSQTLEQILVNLLVNAAESADKPDSWIKIKVMPHHPDARELTIAVGDNGCGIRKNILDKIFEPFFTLRKRTGGTGLGLYICRTLIDQIGGRIEVESIPGEGSTFHVIMPMAVDM